jgi:hypothetical protein
MRAIALTVNPVKPKVVGGFAAGDSGDIGAPSFAALFEGAHYVGSWERA